MIVTRGRPAGDRAGATTSARCVPLPGEHTQVACAVAHREVPLEDVLAGSDGLEQPARPSGPSSPTPGRPCSAPPYPGEG